MQRYAGAPRGVRLDSPAAVRNRGAHATDRARCDPGSQPNPGAVRRGGAASQDSADRISREREPTTGALGTAVQSRSARARLDRGPERDGRVSLGGREHRSPPRSRRRARPGEGRCHCGGRYSRHPRGAVGDQHDSHCLRHPVRPGRRRIGEELRAPRWKHNRIGLPVRGADHQAASAAEGGRAQRLPYRATRVRSPRSVYDRLQRGRDGRGGSVWRRKPSRSPTWRGSRTPSERHEASVRRPSR